MSSVEATALDELSPCPFCGAKADAVTERRGNYIECRDCRVTMWATSSMEHAVERWNKRDITAHKAALEAAGYRIVPVEATEEMLIAGTTLRIMSWCPTREIYRAMLEAAPKETP